MDMRPRAARHDALEYQMVHVPRATLHSEEDEDGEANDHVFISHAPELGVDGEFNAESNSRNVQAIAKDLETCVHPQQAGEGEHTDHDTADWENGGPCKAGENGVRGVHADNPGRSFMRLLCGSVEHSTCGSCVFIA
jgi:hypothetical protein